MHVRVEGCSDCQYWYNDQIGKSFQLIRNSHDEGFFLVADKDGYTNIIMHQDGVAVAGNNTGENV